MPLPQQRTEEILALLAGILLVISQLLYIINTFKGKVQPSILSWIGWAILTGTSFVSQYMISGWTWNFTGLLLSTIGCIVVSGVAITTKNYSIQKKDWLFVVLGFLCMAIYILSKNAWATTVFAILADFLLGLPTIIKANNDPSSEKSSAWSLGLASWSFSLIICLKHDVLFALFPIYLFLFNVIMVYLTMIKTKISFK
jgi:hypothetical protein